jgi:hypothetical protein
MVDDTNLLGVFASAGVLIYLWWLHTHIRRVAPLITPDPILKAVRSGTPIILYFSSPDSETDCNAMQRAALKQLRHALSDPVQIVEIDATLNLQAAERWDVITTPTTFVLDDTLQTCYMNIGVAEASTLMAQLLSVTYYEELKEEVPF